jgi:hypothetical protein
MSSYLFGSTEQKSMAELATERVRKYRTERLQQIAKVKEWLISTNGPIIKTIENSSKDGKLKITIELGKMKPNQFGVIESIKDHFECKEIKQLVIEVTRFLEEQGFSHHVDSHNYITASWEDPVDMDSRKAGEQARKEKEEAELKAKEELKKNADDTLDELATIAADAAEKAKAKADSLKN